MRNLKLFSKTYIFTMILVTMIIFVSHILIYMLLPAFYNDKMQKELDNISTLLVRELKNVSSENSMEIAEEFAMKYKINVTLTVDGKTNSYEGINQADIHIKSDELKDKDLVFPDIEGNIINNNLNNPFNDNNLNDNSSNPLNNNLNNTFDLTENGERYITLKNSSIFRSSKFESLNGSMGEVQIIMTLQSLKEARSVVFKILPYSIGISLIISIIASYIYVKALTDPIKKICDVTKNMEALDKEAYCEINTGDEMELLAENINSLYSTLWSTIDNLESEIKNVSKSEKMKVDFLRSASHELKTPLMSIHIMLENMILNVGKYKNHDLYLNKCKDEVDKLSNMVKDILNTSRLNTFDKNVKYTLVDIRELLEETLNPYKVTVKHKKINLKIYCSNSVKINTDKDLFNKALSNIISNSVNYTDPGKDISIHLSRESLIIENQCKAIGKEHLERVFEAFYRVEFDRNKNTGGNGLGLYIVRQVLNTLNIGYSFEAVEKGMRFTMIFNENLKSRH